MGPDDAIASLADRVAAARRLTVLTGAGVSAASGIPTFRGLGGLWRNFRPEDLATP
ncbi:MAG: Sir2 family NAD-dependent protein deacetylase, partial [Syntrophomonadaceae bacterium]